MHLLRHLELGAGDNGSNWPAEIGDQDQGFHRRLPLRRFVLGLRRLGDVFALSVRSWRPRGSGIGSSNDLFQPVAVIRRTARHVARLQVKP